MKVVKKILIGLLLFSLVVIFLAAGFLALPSSSYLRKAIKYRQPRIDNYYIFYNRVVKAGDPAPWKQSVRYNKCSLPEKDEKLLVESGAVAFVVIQNDSLVFEQYWEDYSSQSHSNSFSAAKSIVSLAIGCAIDDGRIRSIDQPVSDFFPSFKGYNGKVLTLRNLLTMSSGLDFDESYNSAFSATAKLYYGDDLSKIIFGMKEVAEPGKKFLYQSAVSELLAFIVTKAVGENLSSYVSRKLWTPMQAEENALWSLDRSKGMEKAYCCFNTNARDFARFGQLILNHGKWNGKQLVSENYIMQATTPDTTIVKGDKNEPNREYGLQFWITDYKGMKIPNMDGMLGQFIFAIPEMNAVVVRLGHTMRYDIDDKIIALDAAMQILSNK